MHQGELQIHTEMLSGPCTEADDAIGFPHQTGRLTTDEPAFAEI